MSDEHPVEPDFTDEAGDQPSEREAQSRPKPGVALSVLWWVEGEPERS